MAKSQAISQRFLLTSTHIVRIVRRMLKRKPIAITSNRRPAVNLTLSPRTLRQGRKLQRLMHRPSLSNVVEYLITQESQRRAA